MVNANDEIINYYRKSNKKDTKIDTISFKDILFGLVTNPLRLNYNNIYTRYRIENNEVNSILKLKFLNTLCKNEKDYSVTVDGKNKHVSMRELVDLARSDAGLDAGFCAYLRMSDADKILFAFCCGDAIKFTSMTESSVWKLVQDEDFNATALEVADETQLGVVAKYDLKTELRTKKDARKAYNELREKFPTSTLALGEIEPKREPQQSAQAQECATI